MKHFPKTLLLFFSVFVWGFHAFPQDKKLVDSLQRLVSSAPDTVKVKALHRLSKCYFDQDNALSKAYALRSLELAKSTQFKKGVADASNDLGNLYESAGDHDSAFLMFTNSLRIYREINDRGRSAAVLYNIGSYFDDLGEFRKALTYFYQAYKIDEELGDSTGIAYDLNIIGSNYFRLENFPLAMDYFQRALKVSTARNNKSQMAINLNNVGLVYNTMHKFDNALEYYQRSLKLHEEFGDKMDKGLAYGSMGTFCAQNKKYSDALFYLMKEKKIMEELNDSYNLSIAQLNLGLLYSDMKQYDDALKYLKQALEITQQKKYLLVKANVYQTLSDLCARKKDFKQAYEYHLLYVTEKDSMLNAESNKQIAEMNSKYESEKKDKALIKKDAEISRQTIESKQKAMQRNGFIAGFLLMILLAIFIFRGYKQKQKANVEISLQKEIIEEKNKEITDSIQYAKRIQYALLASAGLLQKHLPEHFVFFKPKDIVSGDFYWATEHNNNFYLAVCDSTGHGVPGAFMSILNIGFLSEAIKEKNIVQPNEILNYVRERLIDTISKEGQKDGMDCILLRLETNQSAINKQQATIFSYAAANNEPILLHASKITELPKDKMPVGKGERTAEFTNHTVALEKGDSLILYTDGYADQFGGEKGKKFKYKPLNEMLLANQQKSSSEQKEILYKTLEDWKGNLEQIDDVLVVGIKI